MNVGMILGTEFIPHPRVKNEALSLTRCGHTVFIYCIDYTHKKVNYEIIEGIHVVRYRMPRYLYKLSALAYTYSYYHHRLKKSLFHFLTQYGIHIVHLHNIDHARSIFAMKRKINLPIVLDLHENKPEIMKYYAHVRSFPGCLLIYPSTWKKYEYRYIKEADKIIVVTPEAKQYYVDRLPVSAEKICIVPNTVEKTFYQKPFLHKQIIDRYRNSFTLLYVGDTSWRRGIATAIQSLVKLAPKIPSIKLLVVGNSRADKTLKRIAINAGCAEYVDFVGRQNFELFPSYIMASSLGICPIHKNIHHETTYANKLFQYMAFGKPVVVSDCRAQAAMVEKYQCGVIFRDQDYDDFSDKILTLYHDKKRYQLLGRNGKKAIEATLHWENFSAKTLCRLYDEL